MNTDFKSIESLIAAIANMFGIENFNLEALMNQFFAATGLDKINGETIVAYIESYISETFKAWIRGILITTIIILILYLIYYIITSIAWFKIGKKHGIKYYGLAWVPVLRTYVIGESATAYSDMKFFGKWKLNYVWIIWLLFPVASGIIGSIFNAFGKIPYAGVVFTAIGAIIGVVLTVGYFVFKLCVLFRLYSTYVEKKHAGLYTILSILEIPVPFLVLSLVKKERISDGEDFYISIKKDSDKKAEDKPEEDEPKSLPESTEEK